MVRLILSIDRRQTPAEVRLVRACACVRLSLCICLIACVTWQAMDTVQLAIALHARGVVGIDYAGQPVCSFMSTPTTFTATATAPRALGSASDDLPNDPYALNLSRSRIRTTARYNSTVQAAIAPGDDRNAAGEVENAGFRFHGDVSARFGAR